MKPGAPTRQTVAARQTLALAQTPPSAALGSGTDRGRFQANSVPDDSDRAPAVSSELQRPGANHTPPEVIEPDGICTQITIADPDNPAPATIEVNDETDPDCHTPGIIYQQADDTVIDATVDTTATDWATRCRALGKTVAPLGAGHGGNERHTFEESTRTRQVSTRTSGCVTATVLTRDNGRRDRTVFDCREAGAHTTAAGDGHAHEWLAEPWQA